MNTKDVAKNGVKWTTLSTATTAVVGLLRLSILTRFLEKSDFGIVSIVMLVLGLTQTFSDLGFAAAIMHKQDLSRKEFSSLYWIQLFIYTILFVLISVCSPLIARFYDTEALVVLLPITLLDLIFMGIGRLYGTLLQKNFQFKTIALRNIISAVLSLILAVVLAAFGAGVYSLIVSTLFHTLMANVWNLIAGQRQVKLQFVVSIKENIPLIRIGIYQTGTQIVDYLASKIDVLLIGRFLNMEVLGVYSLAKELIIKLVSLINTIAVTVTTPILAATQEDKKKLGATYCKSIHYLTLVTFPIVLVIIVLSKPLIILLYGARYIDAAGLIVILTAWIVEVCVHNPVGGLVSATGRTDLSFYYTLIRIVINTLAVFISVNISISAVAYGQSITSIIIFFILFFMVIEKVTGVSLYQFLGSFTKQGLICLIIGIPFTYAVNFNVLSLPDNAILQLFVYGASLLLTLMIAMYIFMRNDFFEVIRTNKR